MSKGLGRIERAILDAIDRTPSDGSVLVTSWTLAGDVYRPPPDGWPDRWEPTLAQRKAVSRAMHTFVRKRQRYALTGGQGRRGLILFDTADPVSVTWAKLRAAPGRAFVSRSDAKAAARQA